MVCAVKDCGKGPPVWYPRIRVWAMGHTRASTPIPLVFGLPHCRECREKTKLEDLWTDKAVEIIRAAARAYTKVPPDPASAQLDWLREDHDDV